MIRLLLAVVAAAAAASACEELTVTYSLPPPSKGIDVNINICPEENTITSTNPGSDEFIPVTFLEDYDVGFGATRNDAEEICLIMKLNFDSLEEHAAVLREENRQVVPIKGNLDLLQVPVEDIDEYGERITNFCGDLPAYKLVTDDATTRIVPFDQEARAISFTIRKCWFLVLYYSCTTYTFTIATGSSIVFTWFFG